MSVLEALKNSLVAFRATLRDPDPTLRALLGAPESSAGVEVNEFIAMNLAAVWSATRIYAETIPSLPLKVHEKIGNTRVDLSSHYLTALLESPNPDQVPFTYWETFVHHAILWGNGYAEVERNRAGEPIGLHTLLPDRTRAERKDGIVRYITRGNSGQETVLLPHEVFHVPGLGWDGLRGYSVINIARDSMGLGLAAQTFGATFYKNGSTLKGVLTTEGEFATSNDRKRFRESFEAIHQGVANSHLTPVLPKGMGYEKIGIPPDDAQFLETRLFQVREVARWFRLPPHLLGDLADATFSNVEHQGQEFVTYSLMPWLVRIEQAISHRLLFEDEQGRIFAKHSVASLLRGDLAARYQAYSTGRQNGWLSANDVLALEDQNPIGPEGDTYMVQLNMQSSADLLADDDDLGDGDDPNDDPNDDPDDDNTPPAPARPEQRALNTNRRRIEKSHARMLKGVAERVMKREIGSIRKQLGSAESFDRRDFERWMRDFYPDHVEWMRRQWAPSMNTFAEAIYAEAIREVDPDGDPVVDGSAGLFISQYINGLSTREEGRSQGQLSALLDTPEAEAHGAITARISEWEQKRPAKIAAREIIQAGSAFTMLAWSRSGVQRLAWRTVGKNCPLCQTLSGKIVGIDTSFVTAGQVVDPEDGKTAPLTARRNFKHPPLHGGCDCTIVPA